MLLTFLVAFWVAPAQEALENEVKVFTVGREERTIYQGFDAEADRAWGDLYNR